MTLKLLWNEPTLSGIGDRLCDLLYIYAYARLQQAELYTTWPGYTMRSYDVPHRELDIRLDNILKYIKFPSDLHFNKEINANIIFKRYVGGGLSPVEFYTKFVDKKFALEEYVKSVNESSKNFSFCSEIQNYLIDLPDKFVSFHIRRGDKVKDSESEALMAFGVSRNGLKDLDIKTERIIDEYVSNGHINLFFCGDEDSAVDSFVAYADSKGANTYVSTVTPKWRTTYFDIAALAKSMKIVVSQTYSSFSLFASLIGGNKLKYINKV